MDAFTLAERVIARIDKEPVPLSQEETRTLALAVLHAGVLRSTVGSDDPIDGPYLCASCGHHDQDHADSTIVHGDIVRPCKLKTCTCMEFIEKPSVAQSVEALETQEFAGHHGLPYLEHVARVAQSDVTNILETDPLYGGSWQKRGGVGAFMMMARKWDRAEVRTAAHGYDIFIAIKLDTRREGVIDDVRDLRRYLMLVEAKAISDGLVSLQSVSKDSTTT